MCEARNATRKAIAAAQALLDADLTQVDTSGVMSVVGVASVVRIDESKCRKCYACIRQCPVKATKMDDGGTRIVGDICIACGGCLETCAVGARFAEDATRVVDGLLAVGVGGDGSSGDPDGKGRLVAVLDPSFAAAFREVSPGQVVAGLAALGFSEVHDTSSAVARIVGAYRRIFRPLARARAAERGDAAMNAAVGRAEAIDPAIPDVTGLSGERDASASPRIVAPMISSVCPAVVSLIERHYPDLIGNLVPVISPPVLAARMIREAAARRSHGGGAGAAGVGGAGSGGGAGAADAGDAGSVGGAGEVGGGIGLKVVFIGPCISRKAEVHEGRGDSAAAVSVFEDADVLDAAHVADATDAAGTADAADASGAASIAGAPGVAGGVSPFGAAGRVGPVSSRGAANARDVAAAVDAVLTFEELRALFESHDIVLRDLAPRPLDGPVVRSMRQIALAGGVSWLMGISKGLSDDDLVIAAGRTRCIEVMDDLIRGALTPLFVDASMCRGCVDAPMLRRRSPISVRKHIAKAFAGGDDRPSFVDARNTTGPGGSRNDTGITETGSGDAGPDGNAPEIDWVEDGGDVAGSDDVAAVAKEPHAGDSARPARRTFRAKGTRLPIPSEAEISEILAFTGKLTPGDHLDCAMCGYPTCRAFAVAVYQNMARPDMCVHHLMDRLKEKVEHMQDELGGVRPSSFDDIYGSSRYIRAAKDLAERAARTGSTVLLLGESGTGKEVFARAIHAASARRDGPFVSVNCAAIPDSLMESELFGYEEGAFTGATKGGKPGKFELAGKGTIFLDEVGDMSLPLQAKLLRVLQSHKIERVGGTREMDVDVRVIAATNRNLKEMVDSGEFRLDLYYRLNVVTIQIPALRERLEDIPEIINRSLAKLSARCPTSVTSVSSGALRLMLNYDWPGNVRELENALERALNLVDGDIVEVGHLPEHIVEHAAEQTRRERRPVRPGEALDDVVSRAEHEALLEALKSTNNNRSLAAKKLGISRSAFYEKLKKYGIA